MRKPGALALLAILVWPAFALTQTRDVASPAVAVPDQASSDLQLPPPPDEIPDKEVRQYDPSDNSDDTGSRKRSKDAHDTDTTDGRQEAPIPGSVAASNQNSSCYSPGVVEDGRSPVPVQEYSGPAALVRSYSIDDCPLIPEEVTLQESVGLSSVYDTGENKQVNANGTEAGSTLTGTMLNWSLSGRRYFRHDQVAVVYDGNFSHYSVAGGYSGANNSLTVDYTHVIARHLSLNLVESGRILSQNYMLTNPSVGPETIANINLGISPNVQIPDMGMKQFTSTAEIVWRKSSRLSFDAGSSFFGVWQDSTSLHGVTGEQARGDVIYRLTHRTTIGTYYSFAFYLYPGFGESRFNTGGLIYSYAFNRSMQLRVRGGISRVTSLELQTVQTAPPIAALFKTSPGVIDLSLGSNVPDVSAQLMKDFGLRRTVSIAYALGVSPGNGAYMTSRQESISANFTARVMRSYSLSVGLGRDSLESIVQVPGRYRSESATVQLSRAYKRGVGVSLSLQYRYFDINQFTSVRNEVRITSGVTWGSGMGRPWPF